jgi:Putative peptidoglycan binding domain
MRRQEDPARQGGAGASEGEAAPSLQGRARQVQAMRARRAAADRRAQAYNAAHPEACSEMEQLTHGQLGSGAGADIKAVRAWQQAHGLAADGQIGPRTLAAARREAGGGAKPAETGSDVVFAEAEEPAIIGSAPHVGAGGLAVAVVDGGETGAMEAREPPGADEERTEMKEHGSGVKEATEFGVGGKAGGIAAWAALIPALVELVREHRYKEAVSYVVSNIKKEERVEMLKEALAHLAEHYGYKLAPRLLGLLEKAVLAGAIVDVLGLGWEWTSKGLEAIREAHERGERDSRIAIYAYAWSDTVLGIRHQNPGAVGEEPREAMKLGIEDGHATLEQSPDLGPLVLAQYGDPDNARRALEDALLNRAGLGGGGMKTHAGA